MHPFRVAILIFGVGASVANYFAVREYYDRLATTVPTAAPQATLDPNNPFGGGSVPTGGPAPFAWSTEPPNPEIAKLHAVANDKAWMREAII